MSTSLGKRLITLKLDRNLMQKDVANAIGVNVRSLRHYENDERKPDYDTLIKLCAFFDVSADYLLGLSDNPKRCS